MVAVASAGSYLRWVRIMYERQVQAVATITRLGGQVGAKPRPGRVLPWLIGREIYYDVFLVDFRRGCRYEPGVGDALAKLSALDTLEISEYPLRDEDIARMRGLAKLRVLDLNATEVTDECFKYLDGFPSLEILEVAVPRRTPPQITDRGLGNLPVMPKLSCLFLMSPDITDAGLAYLNKQPKLAELHLEGTEITEAGIDSLAKLRSLEDLHIAADGLGPDGDELLRKRLPRVRVDYFYGSCYGD